MSKKPVAFVNNRHIGRRVDLDGQFGLHFLDQGQGVPVILVHGVAQSLYTWREVIPVLAEGSRVLALDLPGCGYSDFPSIQHTIDDFVEVLRAFMQEMGLEKVHFVGVGQGASYALAFSQKFPDLVIKQVLESPGGVEHGYPLRMRWLRHKLIGDLCARTIKEKTIHDLLLQSYFDETRVDNTMIQQNWWPFLQEGAHDALLSMIRHFDDLSIYDQLSKTQTPTMLAWGEQDPFHPYERAEYISHQMPDAQVMLVRNCGHLVHEERTKEFCTQVKTFLGIK